MTTPYERFEAFYKQWGANNKFRKQCKELAQRITRAEADVEEYLHPYEKRARKQQGKPATYGGPTHEEAGMARMRERAPAGFVPAIPPFRGYPSVDSRRREAREANRATAS